MTNVQIQQWKDKMSYLESIIFVEQKFKESISLLKELHANVHSSQITMDNTEETLDDYLWNNMNEECFRTLLSQERVTM